MLVQSSVLDDARVRREVEALAADGHQLTVIGSHPPVDDHPALPARILYTSSPVQRTHRSPKTSYRTARWLLLPEHRVRRQQQFRDRAVELGRSEHFDIVHCHDYPTLAAGFELADGRPVVYDSHECWSGRLRHGRPEPLRRRRQLHDEGLFAQRTAAVLSVSQELCDWLEDHLGIPPPVLVRNTFPLVMPRPSTPSSPNGLVYAGRIGPGRDLSTAFGASLPGGIRLTLAGPVQPGFPVPESVRYDGVLTIDDIPALLASQGLALISLEDTCLNHRLALPNKLFQAVASGIPVVAADLPALRRLVTTYEIGTLYQPGDGVSLSNAVGAAIDRFEDLRLNVLGSQEELSVTADAERLQSVYRGIEA